MARRYGQRPSDLAKGPIDALGFDLAVMAVALNPESKGDKKAEGPKQHSEDPMIFFGRMGHKGWNEALSTTPN